MPLFDNMLGNNESLFIDELALDYEYLPRLLPHRESQQQYIATCIKPLLQGRNGKNLLITGQPGIGKTAATRFVLRELEEKGLDENLYLIYVNCWKKDTAYKVTLEICQQIGYKFTHDKSTDELLKDISKMLNRKAAVFVLDEIDKLSEFSILYHILDDIYKKTILLITNEKSFLASLESRILSRLSAEVVEFKPYNYEETRDILKQRIGYAFVKSCWDDQAFLNIVDKAASLKDIRTGLFLLRESGMLAESNSSRKITLDHAEKAISKLPGVKILSSKDMDKDTAFILNLIKEHTGKTSRDIYQIYKDKTGKSFRTFHRKIKELEKDNLIFVDNRFIDGTPIAVLNFSSKKLSDY